jgi:hypothetical protein
MASLRIEPPRRPPTPRWAIVCWIAEFHMAHGRGHVADGFLMELVGADSEGWGMA